MIDKPLSESFFSARVKGHAEGEAAPRWGNRGLTNAILRALFGARRGERSRSRGADTGAIDD
jgi:hypothetical protein